MIVRKRNQITGCLDEQKVNGTLDVTAWFGQTPDAKSCMQKSLQNPLYFQVNVSKSGDCFRDQILFPEVFLYLIVLRNPVRCLFAILHVHHQGFSDCLE